MMNNILPVVVAKAICDVKKKAFKENQQTNIYADSIKNFANENEGGVIDVAGLADENSTAITDLAEYIDSIEQSLLDKINELHEEIDSVARYVRLLESRETNEETGNTWSINDIALSMRSKVETRIYADGYYLDEDGTAYKANPT